MMFFNTCVGGGVRKDLGAVMYAANVLGSRGPRKMQVSSIKYSLM